MLFEDQKESAVQEISNSFLFADTTQSNFDDTSVFNEELPFEPFNNISQNNTFDPNELNNFIDIDNTQIQRQEANAFDENFFESLDNFLADEYNETWANNNMINSDFQQASDPIENLLNNPTNEVKTFADLSQVQYDLFSDTNGKLVDSKLLNKLIYF